ncbi:MAG: hypothetical protein WCB85_10925 [Candidatus Dormiibacterota bacterium]
MSDPQTPAPRRSAINFVHVPHPRILERRHEKPVQTDDERVGFNGRLGAKITAVVGTMWVAYIFTVLALISLPGAVSTKDTVVIVAWIAQTFLQLVLLPIIIVGQNVQSSAADKRAVQTYADAEAILHECLQLQAHLQAQDQVLEDLITAHRPAA